MQDTEDQNLVILADAVEDEVVALADHTDAAAKPCPRRSPVSEVAQRHGTIDKPPDQQIGSQGPGACLEGMDVTEIGDCPGREANLAHSART